MLNFNQAKEIPASLDHLFKDYVVSINKSSKLYNIGSLVNGM